MPFLIKHSSLAWLLSDRGWVGWAREVLHSLFLPSSLLSLSLFFADVLGLMDTILFLKKDYISCLALFFFHGRGDMEYLTRFSFSRDERS